ncbi:unnamed protein product [Cuscuta europaea]|uniref:Uncharacterized protein n=1 Tax=Cuscuta europaea TaxID=41803 RepID=A0A9P1EIE8_CUSEU|nr:unnamed protein product [Cuscuta europaea]
MTTPLPHPHGTIPLSEVTLEDRVPVAEAAMAIVHTWTRMSIHTHGAFMIATMDMEGTLMEVMQADTRDSARILRVITRESSLDEEIGIEDPLMYSFYVGDTL